VVPRIDGILIRDLKLFMLIVLGVYMAVNEIKIAPFHLMIDFISGTLSKYNKKVEVKLSELLPFVYDIKAAEERLREGDYVVYEYYENSMYGKEGELNFGVTIIHPGLIGNEYHFTRGHYHAKEYMGEVYVCIKGKGLMLMQNRKGDFHVLPLERGYIVYVPGGYAHRTVNIGDEDLIYFYVYPADAGHDYETIARKGFKKLVLKVEGRPQLIDNPKYMLD